MFPALKDGLRLFLLLPRFHLVAHLVGRGLSWIVRLAMRLLSYRIRNKAKRHHVSYSFLFMRASGDQLREIGSLIESGIIRPVMDRVFPFESTKEALAYVETGRAKGKVVVKVR